MVAVNQKKCLSNSDVTLFNYISFWKFKTWTILYIFVRKSLLYTYKFDNWPICSNYAKPLLLNNFFFYIILILIDLIYTIFVFSNYYILIWSTKQKQKQNVHVFSMDVCIGSYTKFGMVRDSWLIYILTEKVVLVPRHNNVPITHKLTRTHTTCYTLHVQPKNNNENCVLFFSNKFLNK